MFSSNIRGRVSPTRTKKRVMFPAGAPGERNGTTTPAKMNGASSGRKKKGNREKSGPRTSPLPVSGRISGNKAGRRTTPPKHPQRQRSLPKKNGRKETGRKAARADGRRIKNGTRSNYRVRPSRNLERAGQMAGGRHRGAPKKISSDDLADADLDLLRVNPAAPLADYLRPAFQKPLAPPGISGSRLHSVSRAGGDRDDRPLRLLMVGGEPSSRFNLRHHGKTLGRADFPDGDRDEPPVARRAHRRHSGFSPGRRGGAARRRLSTRGGSLLDLGRGPLSCNRIFRRLQCVGNDSQKRGAAGGDGKHVDLAASLRLPGAGADRLYAGLDADDQPDQSGDLRRGDGACLLSRNV